MIRQLSILSFGVVGLLLTPTTSLAQKSLEDGGDWRPDKKLVETLQQPFEKHGISVRPPPGFSRTEHPRASQLKDVGIQVLLWTHESESTSERDAFMVMLFPPLNSKRNDDAKTISGYLEELKKASPEAKVHEELTGRISGIKARRVSFELQANDNKRAGFLIALSDKVGRIQVHGMVEDGDASKLKTLECSALTLSRD